MIERGREGEKLEWSEAESEIVEREREKARRMVGDRVRDS